MKNSLNYIFVTFAIALIAVVMPSTTSAETLIEVEEAGSVGATLDTAPSGVSPAKIQQLIKQRLDNAEGRLQTAEESRNFRNDALSSTTINKRPALMASSTRPTPAMLKAASTTRAEMKDLRAERQEDRKNMREIRMDMFKNLQERLINQSKRAIGNLEQIRTRISANIEKAKQGDRDMTEVEKLLAIADGKIVDAKTAVDALGSYVPKSATTQTQETDDSIAVDLEKPRVLGSDAIKSINEARRALANVVVAIAHSMGLKLGVDNDGRVVNATSTETR